jgi:nuclear pore complex protein Nup62
MSKPGLTFAGGAGAFGAKPAAAPAAGAASPFNKPATGGFGATATGGTSTAFTKPGTTGAGFGAFSKPAAPAKPRDPCDFTGTNIQDKTVQDVLTEFERSLKRQVTEFQTQASQIAKWDRSIYECLAVLNHLEDQIKTIESSQRALDEAAKSLLREQDAFIRELQTVRGSGEQRDLWVDLQERQRIFRLAHDLGEQFSDMENQLADLVKAAGEDEMESASDVDKLAKITNCHLEAMQWIAEHGDQIDRTLDSIERKLKGAGN